MAYGWGGGGGGEGGKAMCVCVLSIGMLCVRNNKSSYLVKSPHTNVQCTHHVVIGMFNVPQVLR